MRSARTIAVGTCAWLFIQPPCPSGRKTSPRFSQNPPERSAILPVVFQDLLRLAAHELIQPVVHADAKLLAGLRGKLFCLKRHTFELTKVPRAVRAATNARYCK